VTAEVIIRPSTALGTPQAILEKITEIGAYLGTVTEPREAASFVDQADSIRYLAHKAHMGEEVERQAAELSIRAKRAAGKVLAAVERDKRKRTDLGITLMSSSTPFQKAKEEAGITDITAQRWRAVAAVPETVVVEYLAQQTAEGNDPTVNGLTMRAAREAQHLKDLESPTKSHVLVGSVVNTPEYGRAAAEIARRARGGVEAALSEETAFSEKVRGFIMAVEAVARRTPLVDRRLDDAGAAIATRRAATP
jgi:hypothetical protein